MSNAAIRALGYVRVSTPGQAQSGESLTTQQEAIKAFAEREGYDLLAIHSDEGISGKTIDARPGLKALLEQVQDRACDIVIVHRMSRRSSSAMAPSIANIALP